MFLFHIFMNLMHFFYSFSDGDEMVWRGYPEKYGLMSQVFMMKISSLNRQTYIVNEKK